MPLLTRRQLSCLKQVILYPRTEQVLCLALICSLSALLYLNGPNQSVANRYYSKKVAEQFFLKDEVDQVKDLDEALYFLQSISKRMYWAKQPMPYKPISLARIAMYHAKVEFDCFNRTIISSEEVDILFKFGLSCNAILDPNNNETIGQDMYESLQKMDNYTEICSVFNCSSLVSRYTEIQDFVGHYQQYGQVGHIIDIPANKSEVDKILYFLDEIGQLMTNLRAIVFKLTYYNVQDKNILTVRYILESIGDRVVKTQLIIDMVDTQVTSLILNYILLSILLLFCILYSLRLIFEVQLGIIKLLTAVAEIVFIFLLVFLGFSQILLFSLLPEDLESQSYPKSYVSYDNLLQQKKGIKVLMHWVLFFMPFKVFQVLIHFPLAKPVKELLNIYARMYPGTFWFLLNYFGICYLSQALGFSTMFGPYLNLCKTVLDSFVTILSTEISLDAEYEEIIENYEVPVTQISAVFITHFYLLIISFFVAELGFLFKKAVHFEKANVVSPKQLQLQDQHHEDSTIAEIKKKVEELYYVEIKKGKKRPGLEK